MAETRGPSRLRAFLVVALGCVGIALLIGLGIWQLERRTWKHDLIARVERRVHAVPVAAPGPSAWPALSAEQDEYTRISLTGRFLNDRETLVQAVTDLGGGFWVMTPFRIDQGFTVLVNRGFVPPDRRDPGTRGQGLIVDETVVSGLLRMTEPKGGFLRSNQPGAQRWYSRDVQAIAAARGLSDIAPYFIDADDRPNPGGLPRGGLTVIAFADNHLVYALTWFGLAILPAAAVVIVLRDEWRVGRKARARGDDGIAASRCC